MGIIDNDYRGEDLFWMKKFKPVELSVQMGGDIEPNHISRHMVEARVLDLMIMITPHLPYVLENCRFTTGKRRKKGAFFLQKRNKTSFKTKYILCDF